MQQEADPKRGASGPQEVADRSNKRQTMLSPEDPVILMLATLAHEISFPIIRFDSSLNTRRRLEAFFTQWHTHFDQVIKALDHRVTQLEAAACVREELEEEGEVHGWPEYASENIHRLVANVKGLQDSIGDASQMLFHTAEMETLLGWIEDKARNTNRKYEARLAASLRDICRVHNPSELSQEQVDCLKACVTALVEGWGKITREKLNFVRTLLLAKGLTWLPVTEKAAADLQEAKAPDLR